MYSIDNLDSNTATPLARRDNTLSNSPPPDMPARTVLPPYSSQMQSYAYTGDSSFAVAKAERDPLPSQRHPDTTTVPQKPHSQDAFTSFHNHRDSVSTSTSTSATDSTNSSPTTAFLLDSSASATETPGTSPDTPDSVQSLSRSSLAMRSGLGFPSKMDSRLAPVSELSRAPPPTKRARNLKNLAVDTSTAVPLGRAISTAGLPIESTLAENAQIPAPQASPAFVRPLAPPRRKSSNLGLTITTPALSQSQSFHAVPPTPSLVRPTALRHFPSSPSLPVMSPSLPPEGGMRFPAIRPHKTVDVHFAGASLMEHEEDEQPNFDIPQSRDEQPEAYPDGPICIYDPHVYLFYEPTAEQASNYDVIFNVASEVLNPFDPKNAAALSKDTLSKDALPKDTLAPAQTASPQAINATENISSPSTPTPTQTPRPMDEKIRNIPEYIHVPWEHNTDIVPDLYHLVKVIDERVQQGKRILIHCQCGVSRSASLIVAYGLYKNPSVTVQEAYNAVKRRSKWIGPNMNLIMQLQEFRSGLLKSSAGMTSPLSSLKPASKISYSHSVSRMEQSPTVPQSAPLQPPPASERSLTIETLDNHAKGPSSAPSGFPWPSDESRTPTNAQAQTATAERFPPSAFGDAMEHVQPANLQDPASTPTVQPNHASKSDDVSTDGARIQKTELNLPPSLGSLDLGREFSLASPLASTFGEAAPLFSPRSEEFAMTPVQPPQMNDIDMFGLSSPRASTFAESGTMAMPTGSLAMAPTGQIHEDRSQHHVQLPPISNAYEAPLMSPRSEQFAMAPLQPPTGEDTHGLMSPRADTFALQLPLRAPATRFSAILPPADGVVIDPAVRAQLKSQIGMSTRSSNNMHAQYQQAVPDVEESVPEEPSAPVPQPTYQPELDYSDALLSPRATEFTNNPFHDALSNHSGETTPRPPETVQESRKLTLTPPTTDDPRSPAQKGASPIVRNILDVF